MTKASISNPAITWPLWRRFVPIQSAPQLASILVFLLFVLIPLSFLDGNVRTYVTFGACVGLLPSLLYVLPAQMVWERTYSATALAVIESVLTRMHYTRVETSDEKERIFRPKLPAFLRWKEGNIRVLTDGDQVVITGPIRPLKTLRSFLNRQL